MILLGQYARDVLKRASLLNHYASDVFLSNDDLMRPFGRLDSQKAELSKLKHDAVFDPGLKPKMTELEAKIAYNQKVLDRLERECSSQGMTDRFLISAMREKLRFLSEQIETEHARYGDRTSKYREAAIQLGDVTLADKNSNVIEARQEHDARCAELREEYAKVSDNVDALEGILRSFKC